MSQEQTTLKKRLFFSYYGQEYFYKNEYGWFSGIVEASNLHLAKHISSETAFLKLKPLSSITDEDAIHVANTVSSINQKVKVGRNDKGLYVEDCFEGRIYIYPTFTIQIIERRSGIDENFNHFNIDAVDFIRSKGYALPWMGISVDDQVKAGWIRLKT